MVGANGDAQATVIPVVEEELVVEGRVVATSPTLRVRKTVEHETVDVAGELSDVQFDVERVTVERVISEPAAVRQDGDVTIVPVMEERVIVSRQLVLKEEIRITRRTRSRPLQTSVDLRREQVVIETFDAATRQWRPVHDPPASDPSGPLQTSEPDRA